MLVSSVEGASVFRTSVFTEARRRGWSDNELSRRMGMSQSYVCRVHLGQREIARDFIAGALRAFADEGLTYTDLFWVDEERLLKEVAGV